MKGHSAVPEELRSGERLIDEGRQEEALSYLWKALEEARARDDSWSLARILTLAQEIRARDGDHAGAEAVCAAAHEALFAAEKEEAEERPEDIYAPPKSRRASAALLGGLVLTLLLAVAVSVGIRIAVERISPAEEFAPPDIEVVPTGAGTPESRPITDEGVFLVPLDGARRLLLARVATRLEQKVGVPARVLPHVRSEEQSLNGERDQLEGDALIDQLWHAYPTGNPRAAIIGVTNGDLYWRGAEGDRFSFGVVADSRYAVISVARMDPTSYGDPPDEPLVEERLRKMVIRYAGTLYYGLERTPNDDSVMRSSIRSLADLDAMSEEFCPHHPGEIASC